VSEQGSKRVSEQLSEQVSEKRENVFFNQTSILIVAAAALNMSAWLIYFWVIGCNSQNV
jgi:hypothetical protein